MRNRKKLVVILACLLLALCTAGISAYFMDADQLENEFTIGESRIELEEEFDPPEKLEPGVSFTKDVKVKNVSGVACYVRMLAVFTNSDMGRYCTVDWNQTDWVYNEKDGYWYYKEPISKDQSTTSLFTKITLSEDIPAAKIEDFNMLVYAECYQAYDSDAQKPFASYQDAWDHYRANRPDSQSGN